LKSKPSIGGLMLMSKKDWRGCTAAVSPFTFWAYKKISFHGGLSQREN
jgi:hypothetical protein